MTFWNWAKKGRDLAQIDGYRHGALTPDTRYSDGMAVPPADVPQHIAETIAAITQLHAEHHQKSTFAERVVDQVTAFIGRPAVLLSLLVAAAAWAGVNGLSAMLGGNPPDPPPFMWMELGLTLAALLIAVLILTSQRRADRLANLREQMILEAVLMTEQKTRKIIELLEELRRDSPEIQDRQDTEAAQMAAKADPRAVRDGIEDDAIAAAQPTDLRSSGEDPDAP